MAAAVLRQERPRNVHQRRGGSLQDANVVLQAEGRHRGDDDERVDGHPEAPPDEGEQEPGRKKERGEQIGREEEEAAASALRFYFLQGAQRRPLITVDAGGSYRRLNFAALFETEAEIVVLSRELRGAFAPTMALAIASPHPHTFSSSIHMAAAVLRKERTRNIHQRRGGSLQYANVVLQAEGRHHGDDDERVDGHAEAPPDEGEQEPGRKKERGEQIGREEEEADEKPYGRVAEDRPEQGLRDG
eukprot:CAMPEP_0197464510 /NCGR_PEP_ID=MMETSP1175-20131217/64061_1 /TAXON_ID=1003142 /ORGANISM="Triceratium dubium, Strain CCMP147" /LENGTH=244 /DNA_ID=CAMNT_0043000491 /DNA_START=263 /DNA_END=996 /DNA_ORIENTATION=-